MKTEMSSLYTGQMRLKKMKNKKEKKPIIQVKKAAYAVYKLKTTHHLFVMGCFTITYTIIAPLMQECF